ncbi:MAG: hypothetical protein ACRYE8_04515 [Janthinobacterium lividum]
MDIKFSFRVGIVAWIEKSPKVVIPWLDHGIQKKARKIELLI